MRILGLDPGLATTGYAFLEVHGLNKKLIQVGVIRTAAKLSLSERLCEIEADIEELLKKYKPDHCGIERLFFTKNITNGIQVAHARGVLLLCLQRSGIPVVEYTPSEMKSRFVGNGRADKIAIQKMTMLELQLKAPPKPDDAADALALALITCNGLLQKAH
jgi:crossover junction endodeoxyribonuclease RuvC